MEDERPGDKDDTPILIGCVSAKRDAPAPARDLYVSPLFVRRREYAEASGGRWLVFSALYGIVEPDAAIAPYDVSLKNAGFEERRRIGELVATQLEARLGRLAGRTFEIHAGKAYVDALGPALTRRGARLTNPLEGLRIGEQLHWYNVRLGRVADTERPEGPAAKLREGQAGSPVVDAEPLEVAILSTTPTGPFRWRWPTDAEEFARGWDLVVRASGGTYRLRHGIGRRLAYGRYRVRTVTWVQNQPTVEGVEADDYNETGGLISVLRLGGRTHVRSRAAIPAGYAGFQVVDHATEIRARYTRHSLAVKLAEDDLVGWARHALLRAWSKTALPSAAAAAPPAAVAPRTTAMATSPRIEVPSSPMPAPSQPAADRRAVVQALLDYAATHPMTDERLEPVFTPNPEANRLVIENPFAFLLAVIFDQGIVAERAWAAPYLLKERLGHLDPARIVAEPERVEAAVRTPPMLQRFVNRVPHWVCSAAARVLRDHGGDAGRIWDDNPTADELQRRLDVFDGIGQKKAAMAVEILARDLRVPIRDLQGSDIAFDVHVRRVFLRTGLAERDDLDHMVVVARELHPERPGEIDFPAWAIGRQWCRPGVPLCPECAIAAACPKLVERAAQVQGA